MGSTEAINSMNLKYTNRYRDVPELIAAAIWYNASVHYAISDALTVLSPRRKRMKLDTDPPIRRLSITLPLGGTPPFPAITIVFGVIVGICQHPAECGRRTVRTADREMANYGQIGATRWI
jgi:hypothetical protein